MAPATADALARDSRSTCAASSDSIAAYSDQQLSEMDIADVSLAKNEPATPLTPVSSRHSSSPMAPRHSRSSSLSSSIGAVSPPSPSPSPSPGRSRSSSELRTRPPNFLSLSMSRSESQLDKLQLTDKMGLLAVGSDSFEDDLPTPRPTTLAFMEIKGAADGHEPTTDSMKKPIPSLIGPESLQSSGIDAAIFVGTNLQPGDFDLSSRAAPRSPTDGSSHASRAKQRLAYIDQAWQARERYNEAMAVRLEIERMKREVQGAIAMQTALQAQQTFFRAQQRTQQTMLPSMSPQPAAFPNLNWATTNSWPASMLNNMVNTQLNPALQLPQVNGTTTRLPFPPGLPLPPGLTTPNVSPLLPMTNAASLSLITSQQQQQTVQLVSSPPMQSTPARQQTMRVSPSPVPVFRASRATSSNHSFHSTIEEQPTRSALGAKTANPRAATLPGARSKPKGKGKALSKDATGSKKDEKQTSTRNATKSSVARNAKSLRA